MKPLTVIAKLKAKSGREEQPREMLQSLVEPTRAEKGCISYDLHRSHEDPRLFVFYESWQSRPWNYRRKAPKCAASRSGPFLPLEPPTRVTDSGANRSRNRSTGSMRRMSTC